MNYLEKFQILKFHQSKLRRCIDAAAKGGGFILTSSNSLHANCKIENIYTMVDEARRYGKYPLERQCPDKDIFKSKEHFFSCMDIIALISSCFKRNKKSAN